MFGILTTGGQPVYPKLLSCLPWLGFGKSVTPLVSFNSNLVFTVLKSHHESLRLNGHPFKEICTKEIEKKLKCTWRHYWMFQQWLISLTFYLSVFCTKVLHAAFLQLHFGFVIFWHQNIYEKVACKMLMKFTRGLFVPSSVYLSFHNYFS